MTNSLTTTAPPRGPVRTSERALAPDLARGAMLLFIALANAANCAFAGQPGVGPNPHGLQRIVNFFLITFVDARAYPLFGLMFGYSLVQLARRQRESGGDERRVLLRRNAWLIAFGFAHATLLYFGDFLGAYGIVGIIATLVLVRRSDKFHRLVLWIWGIQLGYAAVLAAIVLGSAHGGHARLHDSPNHSLAAHSYARSIVDRLTEWPVHTATVIPFIVIVWLGMWAARQRILENPAAHRTLLRRVAIGGTAISLFGGLPYGLVSAGALHVDSGALDGMAMLHGVSGMYGGIGYAAAFGLLALRLSSNQGNVPMVKSVVALGQRSLSGYLFQSVAWVALFSPWALDLGGSTYFAVVAAVAVWAVSVFAAGRMDARADRGPAETLLRRLTYGSRV
jgi:uncharacterized protein